MNTSTTARMLADCTRFPCNCCTDDTKRNRRRAQKRRERQAWKKDVRNV